MIVTRMLLHAAATNDLYGSLSTISRDQLQAHDH
jgi:hypothetical protein